MKIAFYTLHFSFVEIQVLVIGANQVVNKDTTNNNKTINLEIQRMVVTVIQANALRNATLSTSLIFTFFR